MKKKHQKDLNESKTFVNITANPEQTMAYIARVSNPNNQDNENYAGLLRYCIKHQHWSVFEQSSMTLEIKLPVVLQHKY